MENTCINAALFDVPQISYLGVIGGSTVKDTTRRILKSLLSNMLAMTFNFNGHGVKHAFGVLQLKDVVNGSFLVFFLPQWVLSVKYPLGMWRSQPKSASVGCRIYMKNLSDAVADVDLSPDHNLLVPAIKATAI